MVGEGRHISYTSDRQGAEIRCYMRDPDDHLIEVGQATGVLT